MPRLRFLRQIVPFGLAALPAALAPLSAVAQVVEQGSLFQPKIESDARDPPRFRTGGQPASDAPTRFGSTPNRFGPQPSRAVVDNRETRFEIPTYGNPPGSGAGATGFDSTNDRRNRAAKAATKKPVNGLAPPPVGADAVKPKPAQPAPVPLSGAQAATARAISHEAPQRLRRDAVQPEAGATPTPLVPPVPQHRRPPAETDPYDPPPIRVGAFLFRPAIELTVGYDSNAARSQSPQGSAVFIVAPELHVQSDWLRHSLTADILGKYTEYPSTFAASTGTAANLSRPNLDAKVNARIDVTRDSRIDAEGRVLTFTDNPGSPNVLANLDHLPLATTTGTTLGYGRRFNRFEWSVKGSVDRTTYEDSTLTDKTTSSNADRNFNQIAGALRGSYELSPAIKPFVEVGADTRVHDLDIDRNNLQRNSHAVTARVGSTFELTRQVTGEVSGGYIWRTYKDPTLPEISGFLADAALVWTATALTTVTVNARSKVDESLVAGVSGIFRRDFGAQVDHSFRRWLIGTVKGGFGFDNYVGIGPQREDHRYFVAAALLYKLNPYMQIKAELRRDWLTSSVAGADYSSNTIMFGVRLQH